MTSGFEKGRHPLAAGIAAAMGRFIFGRHHTSPHPIVMASIAAAAVMGIGLFAAGNAQGPGVPAETNSSHAPDASITSALNNAFSGGAEVPSSNFAANTFELTGNPDFEAALEVAPPSWSMALIPAGLTPNRLAGAGLEPNSFDQLQSTFEQANLAVRSGDTMMNLLTDIGIDRTEAHYAIEAFGEVYNPRRIREGQEFNVAYEVLRPSEQGSADDQLRLLNISMRTAPDREVIVRWDEPSDDYVGEARDIPLEERFTRGRGTIDSSLYVAANGVGVPDAVTIDLIRIYSHTVDFQRDIREGDSFDVYYSRRYDEDGEAVMNGNIEYASLVTRGRAQNLYRFTTPDDDITDYYDEEGKSVRAFLMRTPIDGARITSSFGPRRHPVLGYNRMHKGVDFGAPTGTPIYAAGNGTIVRASRYGSYGNYVRIRHANGYETAYAHLSRYGPGIRSGVRVEQGQIIGYVGSTGRVTGAHLHYEVLHNDEQVNPRTIDLPSGRQLEGDILEAFQQERARIEAEMALAPVLEITATASAGGATPGSDLAPE